MEFKNLTEKFTYYVCNNKPKKLSNLFLPDGVYHDYIYGTFKGRNNIENLISNLFYRDGKNFFWEMYDTVFENNMGYAKYRFGFTSNIKEYFGKKVILPGICFFNLKNGFINEYSEVVNGGIAMVQLGVSPNKMEKVFLKWFKRNLYEDKILKEKLDQF